jgi:alpha/beta hydrolase family protein
VNRFVLVSVIMVALVATNTDGVLAANPRFAQTPTAPTVTELPTTATSHPWIAWAPLSNGYVEQEFRLRGMAGIYAYTSAPPPPWDLTLQDMQPYATRMLVRRPSDPAAFNGTVVVEWLNVTNGYDIDPVWGTVAQYFLRSGYAWVGVSAQAAGVEALKKWDPQRYGDLNIVDDGQSYEIFTQAAQALRQPGSRILGDLKIQQVIGTGVSQSAMRLVPYINAFHPLAHVYDGYFVQSRGRGMPPISGVGVFSDLEADPITSDVPVMVFQTEGDLMAMDYAPARQPDTDMLRTWELAGASHVGKGSPLDVALSGGVRSRDTGTAAGLGNPACQPNPFPSWPVADAAWDHLRTWISDGTPPPTAPLIQLTRTPTVATIPPGDSNALVARDDMGNALGGIRTPAIDAPIGAYYGTNTCNPAFLGFLSGWFVPFDSATLAKLYPTHDAYVARVTTSANKAVADGFMLQDDAERLIAEADASSIGKLGPTITP